jgi:hypothetical protein
MENVKLCISAIILMIAATCATSTVMAHGGGHAVNGGIVEVVGDVALELVVLENAIELYVVDDGVEISVEGMSARLKIEQGTENTELSLESSGRNKFSVQNATIASGSKVTCVVVRKDGYSKIIVNFSID